MFCEFLIEHIAMLIKNGTNFRLFAAIIEMRNKSRTKFIIYNE